MGGLYTREEMSLEENDNGNSGNMDVPMKSNPAPIKPDKVAGNQQITETSAQQSNDSSLEGVFILQSFEKGISPQNVPFAKLNVMDKATNEVSLVLVKGKEDVIESLSHVQMGQELALVIKKENGFNFLESYSYVQGNDQPVQSETQLQSEQREPVQAPVPQENETASEPLDAFILEKYEQGKTPAGISFRKDVREECG